MNARMIDKIIALLNPQRHKGEKSYLSTILTEYKNKRPNYEEFRIAAHRALEALLKEGEYKYQIISRTKTHERLEEKLLRKKEHGIFYHSVEEVEDLVGIRIIFYTERDKEKFVKKIKNEIGGFMKIEERVKDNGYRATHIIMSFGRKRLNLSEYKQFRGLKSEVQITSILHHAWAEIEHDLIYKDINNLKIRDPEKFELTKQKIHLLLEKYIKKAATELEEIIDNGTE
ncbi:hypothetical protein A3I95_03010 [Candidatus Nomurabacteria bacterium RIFCSPLOWO2_02_FULL_44_12]|uniref:RelA/SpoT domain-containing protein n=1 Tax=Candidatus Nomurabacteria bacterium RIFCSPLOWO2_12_FULL_44_11 TaxID=1801796 RepID=A0A1F6Y3V6_9BACT|nr:MAG: hypothetical protein A3E95_00215 [Candidatus Nomurabacteria bacterium RIFCSPHIGHO2_12_FULL_44_22b]OGJ00979.1 MAG: hypothetical protein A3G53_02940 [Candidatus Nomurabacteria bacterium RIFCSPLOWO2_12_FULL_44_11]OGJ08236.1 MAG: hypothetical protein A3I95_03010 [Candidatus Nomurabacteria bacterium RIFCSPLOWO2_02_FULL_44_12]